MDEEADRIYKALQLAQDQYFSGEQIFPLWESIYSVIVSGLFIVYVTLPMYKWILHLFTCLMAMVFSIVWALIINRSASYSFARMKRMKYLESLLDNKYPSLFDSQAYTEELVNGKKRWYRETWRIRRLVPVCLLTIWLILLVYTFVAH
ncbi:MAG: hypothetical protein ABSF74_03770 [Dehalococcoidia bacterium]|jgi:hypothetical protein